MIIILLPTILARYAFLGELSDSIKMKLTSEGYTTIRAVIEPDEDGTIGLSISTDRARDQFTVSVAVLNGAVTKSREYAKSRHHYTDEILKSSANQFLDQKVGQVAFAFTDETANLMYADGYSGPLWVNVKMIHKGLKVDDKVLLPLEDYPHDFRLVESIFRLSVSKASGYGIAARDDQEVSGENPMSLAEIQGLNGVQVRRDLANSVVEIRKGEHLLLFKLGSFAATFDGSTVTLDRPLMEKRGEFFIPRSLIAQLQN